MFDLIIRSMTQRKMRTGLTIFGIALGIFAVVVMGGMSEYMNLVVDKSLKLSANDIQIEPDGTLGAESARLMNQRSDRLKECQEFQMLTGYYLLCLILKVEV